MDSLDMKIIKIIEKEGRISHEELSKRLNLSRPAVHNRISKLEEQNIITGYKTTINWSKIGYTTNAIVSLKIQTTDYDKMLLTLKTLQVQDLIIEECHMVTGTWCILLKIRAKTPLLLRDLHDALFKLDGVKESSTVLILSSLYDE